MKKLICLIVLLRLFCFVSSALANDEGKLLDRYEFNENGSVEVTEPSAAKALFFFPDISESILTDFRSIYPGVAIEIYDSKAENSLIPLKFEKTPWYITGFSEIGVAPNLIYAGAGIYFLPILEPGIFIWSGYAMEDFNDDVSFQFVWGFGARICLKF